MQTWATFSIIDHRRPVYRQALALFDRIVVPIPSNPIDDQTQAELDQLRAEVDYLVRNDAAKLVEWKSSQFYDWQRPFLAEAAALKINRDPYQDSRLMLAEQFDMPDKDVQAIPVYGNQLQFDSVKASLNKLDEAMTIEILQRLPVPDENTPLENLVRLRTKPAFRQALADLQEWKQLRLPAIVLNENRKSAFDSAMRDFDKLTRAYAEAMEAEGFGKAKTIGSIFFSIITGDFVGAIKESLTEFRETKEPCWKKISEMKCAPGGVIYQFKESLI